MKIGVSNRCISTELPVKLAGFGNPKRTFTGMHDDLWVRALALKEGERTVAIVTADVLGFEHWRIEELRSVIAERAGVSVDDILFNASHTHSAPGVMRGYCPTVLPYLPEYADWFYEQVVGAVVQAVGDLEEGSLEMGAGPCPGVGINRRRMTTGRYEFAPYEAGVRNDEVFVLRASCRGRVKAILVKATCHPSTVGFDLGSADFPGVMRRIVEEKNPGATALFVQGCCGNIRTRTLKDPECPDTTVFRPGSFDDIEVFGRKLADAAQTVLNSPMKPVLGGLSARKVLFDLPLQQRSPCETYRAAMEGDDLRAWANRYYCEHYETLPAVLPYTLQRIDLGDELTLIAMEGEVVVEYEYHMSRILSGRRVVTAGYSNGSPGYICTAEMYRFGGYEPVGSAACYLLREGWDPACEGIILERAARL